MQPQRPSLLASPECPCIAEDADTFLSTPPAQLVEYLSRVDGHFLVLGAGGKMGLHVCMMLRKAFDAAGRNNRVEAVSRFRSVHDTEEFRRANITTRMCDLTTPADLESLPQEANIIFMAGAKFGTSDQPEMLQKMNVEMPLMVARYFRTSRITAFSTGCVYPFSSVRSPGPTEKDPTNPHGAYAISCLGREQAFLQSSAEFNTRLAIIRLNYSVEFRYGVLLDIGRKVLNGDPIDVAMGHVNLIWQRDAVAHALLAHERASTPGFVINITGPEVLAVRTLAAQFGARLGREPVCVGAEAETAWLSNASLSHGLFGLPETTVNEMVAWISAWLLAERPTFNKPTGFEKRDGNF